MKTARALGIIGILALVALALGGWRVGWSDLWASPDQRGRLLYERGRYAEAAEAFADPFWRGAAAMRGGDFKAAEASFAAVDSAEGAFDQGNALVMLGKYKDAMARYERALSLRPAWPEAEANRRIAALRAARLEAPGGDAGDQREGADQIVYDRNAKNPEGEKTDIAAAPMDDASVRALWLKQVQTRPADFLRSRFAYQLQAAQPPAAGGKAAAP